MGLQLLNGPSQVFGDAFAQIMESLRLHMASPYLIDPETIIIAPHGTVGQVQPAGYASPVDPDFVVNEGEAELEDGIAWAMGELPSTGGKILLIGGDYRMLEHIVVTKPGVEICGDGTNQAYINCSTAGGFVNVDSTKTWMWQIDGERCLLHDFYIASDMNVADHSVPTTARTGVYGVFFTATARRSRIWNVTSAPGMGGIYTNSIDTLIYNCDLYRCGDEGVGFSNGASRCAAVACRFREIGYRTRQSGIRFQSSHECLAFGCRVHDNPGPGISFERISSLAYGATTGNMVLGNVLINNAITGKSSSYTYTGTRGEIMFYTDTPKPLSNLVAGNIITRNTGGTDTWIANVGADASNIIMANTLLDP